MSSYQVAVALLEQNDNRPMAAYLDLIALPAFKEMKPEFVANCVMVIFTGVI